MSKKPLIDFRKNVRNTLKIHPEVYSGAVELVKSIDSERFADFIQKGELTDLDVDEVTQAINYMLYQINQVGKLLALLHGLTEQQRGIVLKHAQMDKNIDAAFPDKTDD